MRWRSIFRPSKWRAGKPLGPAIASVAIPNPVGEPPPGDQPLREPDLSLYLAWEELKLKQHANTSAWGLGTTDRWDIDLDAGVIKFSNADGFTVVGSVQVIGTYNTLDGTWLWGWDHPSVSPPQARAACLARDFGKDYDLGPYTTRSLDCSEDDAWRFTALALYLSAGAGAYRGPAGSTYIYMTFSEVKIMQAR